MVQKYHGDKTWEKESTEVNWKEKATEKNKRQIENEWRVFCEKFSDISKKYVFLQIQCNIHPNYIC